MIGALSALLLALQEVPAARVDDLRWMSGRWQMGDNEDWCEEVWSEPRGGGMIGYSRCGRGEVWSGFEFFRIQAGEDGVVALFAQPQGRAPATIFRLIRNDAGGAAFEDPTHDFPQRVVYRREGDTMTGTISRLDGSGAISWSYRRQ